jgi:predicted nucleic acid-binding protein
VILVDTGPLVALLHAGDRQHERCLNWYDTARGPLIVPQTVAVEVAYFVAQRRGPAVEADFIRSLGPDGPFELDALRPTDMARVAELVEQYADFPLGTVDASVIALTERSTSPLSQRWRFGTSPRSDPATSTRSHFSQRKASADRSPPDEAHGQAAGAAKGQPIDSVPTEPTDSCRRSCRRSVCSNLQYKVKSARLRHAHAHAHAL